MINTVKPKFFGKNIKEVIKKRHEANEIKKNKGVEMTSYMYHLIMSSESYSKSKIIIVLTVLD